MSDSENQSKRPARASKTSRGLARVLDASGAAIWLIGLDGKLAYFSQAATDWLGLEATDLLGRRSVAGSPISDDPLDYLAASLSPPPGLASRGTASLKIEPPPIDGRSIEALEVRFVRLGSESSHQVIAVGGNFSDAGRDDDLRDAVSLRQHLDQWRKHHASIATIATAGISPSAKRLRKRLDVAGSTRSHVGFFGPTGCGAESIASRVHQQSAPREPLVVVEGSLMDAELLEATLTPLVHRLADSDDSKATALVRGLDEMPAEAQMRLAELIETYRPRLRLLAICARQPSVLREPNEAHSDEDQTLDFEVESQCGLLPVLIDELSSLAVAIEPLAARVDDIPLLATAALNSRRAAGEANAERISRGALDALVAYPWPGNLDELNEAVGHAIRHAPGSSIAAEHLPLAIRSFRASEGLAPAAPSKLPLDEAMRRFELQMIEQALVDTDGNRAEAARRLGISRARLVRRLADADPKATSPKTGGK